MGKRGRGGFVPPENTEIAYSTQFLKAISCILIHVNKPHMTGSSVCLANFIHINKLGCFLHTEEFNSVP